VDDGQFAIDVQDHLQAVRKRELLELDFRSGGRGRRLRAAGQRRRHDREGEKDEKSWSSHDRKF